MAHDMKSVSLVQDIGAAVPEPKHIKYQANPALHARNMEDVLDCVRRFLTTASLPAVASMDDINAYFRVTGRNRAFEIPGTTPGNGTIWLYFLAKALQPKVIVESGVYSGSSLFTLRAAAPGKDVRLRYKLCHTALAIRRRRLSRT
jgi:hypothetical protein